MKVYCKWSLLFLAFALTLGLAACGGEKQPDAPENAWEILTDADFDEDDTSWQGDDGSQLRLSLSTRRYTYRTWYGRAGEGGLFEDEDGLSLKFRDLHTDNFYYLVREGDGFTLRHVNGQDGEEWGEMNGLHFERALVEVEAFDIRMLDGVWQNALGKTLAFHTGLMRYIECADGDRTLTSGKLYDDGNGSGPYITGEEVLYPCISADGNSFVLFTADGEAREPGSRSTGVFYRDGNVEAYADLENACFEESDGRLWYFDGVQYFALSEDYTLGEDGRAYDRTEKPFAPDWSEERYDPAAQWGENWLEENWGSND